MFKHTFISIYILPEAFYVVVVTQDKRKVLQTIKFDLPKGLIKNHKVVDTTLFAQVIRKVWQTYRLHNRNVAMVLSEFAAFTKIISVPKVSDTELHEAVLWASQEYLPQELEYMLLDWKIAKEKPDGYDICVIAIPGDVVRSYTESFEKAGLLPMFVEIPSVSLTRLATDLKKNALYVYVSTANSLLVVTQEGAMLGSSVVSGGNATEIINTAKRITAHFKQAALGAVYLCGKGEEVASELEKTFEIKPEPLTVPFKNMSPEIEATFLVPLSLASTSLAEPKDPHSINLLPQLYVEKYRSSKEKVQFWSLILTVTLFVWLSLFTSLGTYLFLSQSASSYTNSLPLDTDRVKRTEDSTKLVSQMNTASEKIVAIKKVTIIPQEVLNLIDMSRPPGISLSSYKLDFDTGEIRVAGVAQTRLALVEYKQNLEKSGTISSVDIPISNFESDVNLPFELRAAYLPVTKTLIQNKVPIEQRVVAP